MSPSPRMVVAILGYAALAIQSAGAGRDDSDLPVPGVLAAYSVFGRMATLEFPQDTVKYPDGGSDVQHVLKTMRENRDPDKLGIAMGWGPEYQYVTALGDQGLWVHASDWAENLQVGPGAVSGAGAGAGAGAGMLNLHVHAGARLAGMLPVPAIDTGAGVGAIAIANADLVLDKVFDVDAGLDAVFDSVFDHADDADVPTVTPFSTSLTPADSNDENDNDVDEKEVSSASKTPDLPEVEYFPGPKPPEESDRDLD